MGEQIHSLTSAHTWLPIMRSSRGKLFMYIIVLGGMGFVIFLLSSVHSNLKQMENSNEKCQQQRDSLSAQLQVVYEHKNRLEKSLQQEKSDHRHTKEEHEKQAQDVDVKLQQEKDKRRVVETQLTHLKTSYAELEVDKKHAESLIKDQLQTMQLQKEQEIKKLQVHISKLLEEKDKLEQSSATLIWKVEQSANEASMCRQQQDLLQQELNKCKEDIQKARLEVVNVDHTLNKQDEGNIPKVLDGNHSTATKLSTTSTPGSKPNVLPKPNIIPSADDRAAEVFEKALNMNKNETNDVKTMAPDPHDAKDMNQGFDVRRNGLLSNNNDVHDMNNAIYQFQPPDSQNQAAERGEYANAVQPVPQVEKPAFRDPSLDVPMNNNNKNNIPVPLDNSAAQARFMLENSPDDQNPFNKKGGSNNFLGGDLGDDRINKLRANPDLPKQERELPEVEDKHQYNDDDDDQDGDNEDNAGAGEGHQDRQQLNEPDFDDQLFKPPESKDIPKPDEGVMISPK